MAKAPATASVSNRSASLGIHSNKDVPDSGTDTNPAQFVAIPTSEALNTTLRELGVVDAASTPRLEPIARNPERRDYLTRASFRVFAGNRAICYLTVGKNLTDLRQRTKAFAEACPDIACKPLFWHQAEGGDYLGIELFEGQNLETLVMEGRLKSAEAVAHAAKIVSSLERTLVPCTMEAASGELERYFSWVCASPIFSGLDQQFLQSAIFPFIRNGALSGPQQSRWTNGDLIARNLLVDARGEVRLVDYEFASRTCFFAEDALRWRSESKLPADALTLPGIYQIAADRPWVEAFFILRHAVLIHEINGASVAVSGLRQQMDRLVALAAAAHAGFRASVFFQPLITPVPPSSAGMAPGGATAQLYWAANAAFSEMQSLRRDYASGEPTTVSFLLPAQRGSLHLRLDPAEASGIISISGIRVRRHPGNTLLIIIDENTGWDALRMGSGLLRLGDSPALNLLSLGGDPNFYLPELNVGDTPCDLVCEVWWRFSPDLAALPDLLRPLLSEPAGRAQTETALAALTGRHSQTEAALAALTGRHSQTEAALAEARKAFAAQTDRQTQTEERLRQTNTTVQDLESAAAQKSQEYRRLHDEANRNLKHAFDLCTFAENEIGVLQDKLFQRDTKVRQMQDSFSWRATYCLRALRRFLIDPLWGKPQTVQLPPPIRTTVFDRSGFLPLPSLRFRSNIEAPRNWSASSNSITIRGWVFAEDPIPFHRIRAHVGDRFYEGTYALNRPDVAAAFPLSGEAIRSGFRIALTIKDDDEGVDLEISSGDGQWHRFFTRQFSQSQGAFLHGSYAHWVKEFDTLTVETISALRHEATLLPSQPLISIVMPVFNTPELWLTKAIDSVKAQVYSRWELCIADDASSLRHVRPLLQRYAAEDQRIKIVFREANGRISAASNSALALATAEFTALFDHDDELPPHALLCVAETIFRHGDAELIYSDEDKIDESGFRFDPHFKPDWNPDLLTGQNYISHLSVYRTATLRAVGAFREGFEGTQDWDLALRVSERVPASHILHIPRVLYHWRAIDGSTATHLGEKNYVAQSARRTLDEHFSRIAVAATLAPIVGGHWHIRYCFPDPAPLVTLIICTRNRRELLVACVESVLAKTNYSNFEILVADNDSDDPELFAFYKQMQARGHFDILPCPGPFNFSAINNRAVRESRGEIIGLLNNDIEVINPDWLGEMVSHALRPGIGAVGAKLYFPDFCLQHAGVITGLGGVAGHAFKGFSRQEPGTPQFRPHLTQNLSAVTAACLVIRKSTYFKAGGLDEKELAVAFNDVDFCLKVEALGLRNLFTPFAELIHHESISRGAEDSPDKIRRFQNEIATMKTRWGSRLLSDPAYNPNLSLDTEDFGLAYPPRVPSLNGSSGILVGRSTG